MNEKLIEIITNVAGDGVEITRDTDLTYNLGLKSIDLLELITDVEDEFGIEVTDEAVENIHTVGELMDYIENNS
jgi:acyl carrier protein